LTRYSSFACPISWRKEGGGRGRGGDLPDSRHFCAERRQRKKRGVCALVLSLQLTTAKEKEKKDKKRREKEESRKNRSRRKGKKKKDSCRIA